MVQLINPGAWFGVGSGPLIIGENKVIFTPEAFVRLTSYLATHDLPAGLGDWESACSIAAINIAISGRLSDDIPACMSMVIGKWIVVIQDAMPDAIRNSPDWKALLPLAAGTGRKLEEQRTAIALAWMWDVVLPQLQPTADVEGFGPEWRRMCVKKTRVAAANAAYKICTVAPFSYSTSFHAAASHAANAACPSPWDKPYTTVESALALAVDSASAAAPDRVGFWATVNPCAVLRMMIEVTE